MRYRALRVYIHYICMYWHYTFINKSSKCYKLSFRNLNILIYSLFIYSKRKPEESEVIKQQTKLVCDNVYNLIKLFERNTETLNKETTDHIIDSIITYIVPVYRCYLDNNITVDYLTDEIKNHLIKYINNHQYIHISITRQDTCDIRACILSIIHLIEMIPDEYTLAEVSLMLNNKLKKIGVVT